MTKLSSAAAAAKGVSVKASGHISLIKIDVTFEHTGNPGDFVTIYEPFFDALDGKFLTGL